MNIKQRGSVAVAVLLGLLGVIVLGIAMGIGTYLSYNKMGVDYEGQIDAIWNNNRNISGNYSLKVREVASVPKMYADDLTNVMTKALSAKYGDKGSQAVFQMLTDSNITIDSAMYTKIQQIIEAGRNEFQAGQTQLLDAKRGYNNQLNYAWSGFWLKTICGFPRVDLNKYNIIVAEDTDAIFKAGKQAPIQLR